MPKEDKQTEKLIYENKICSKCKTLKSFDKFPLNTKTKDGRGSWCRSCHDKLVKVWRKKHQKKCQEYSIDWVTKHRERSREMHRLEIKKYPEKRKARLLVSNAIKAGKLVRLPCEVCGSPKSEAHHPDYSKPLEIKWLCVEHHHQVHKTLRNVKN